MRMGPVSYLKTNIEFILIKKKGDILFFGTVEDLEMGNVL